MSKDLLKEAIADAKAVKETAIANAKAALEETFAPQLKQLYTAKLEEMERMEEEGKFDEMMDKDEEMDEEVYEAELDLDELLAELSNEEELDEEINIEALLKEAEEEGEEESEEEGEEEEGEEEMSIEDMSEEDLKSFIEDVIKDMIEAGELEAGHEEEAEAEEMEMEMPEEEEINIDELLAEIKGKKVVSRKEKFEDKKLSKDLNEAYSVINQLKKDLNDINLLNAKLLYTNKVFRGKTLTESQKVKVLSTFDKAESVKEVKLVFESLMGNLKETAPKSSLKESMSYASKSTGIVAKPSNTNIVDTDPMVQRFQKLAGIIKS
jgi:hypothetical protein